MQLLNLPKLNKKGDISLYFVVFAAVIFAITFIIYINHTDANLQTIGENTVKIINTFETSERLVFYMDASMELAAKSARKKAVELSGYSEQRFKGKIQNPGCGMLAYPIIDADKDINNCFPKYEDVIKVEFTRELNYLLLKYSPFEIDITQLKTNINNNNALQITVNSISDLNLPVYSFIQSYYRVADKTQTQKEDMNTLKKNAAGYWTSKEYFTLTSFPRAASPTKIVLHDTKIGTLADTFIELKTGFNNYNYIIDEKGEIYLFAPENRYTLNSGCAKTGSPDDTCLIENTDRDSISIALVNTKSNKHPKVQTDALEKLLSEIAVRNPGIELKKENILLNSEIDAKRTNDPAPDLDRDALVDLAKTNRDGIISNGILIMPSGKATETSIQTQTSVDAPDANSGTLNAAGGTWTNGVFYPSNPNSVVTQEMTELTGNAVAAPNIDESKCFNGIKTTAYYTPLYDDFKGVWYSGESPCTNSLGYCCIPENKRGFFEEVKCEGSGVYNNQVYHTSRIGINPGQSTPIEGYTTGVTSTQKNPTPKFTVAADPSCPGFNYGSKLYIYWGENDPWNGYYSVEDTGSAFTGRCDKLDIYAGVGQTALDDAKKYVKTDAKVCVLDSNFQMPDPDFSGSSTFVDPVTGEYTTSYKHTVSLDNVKKLFDNSKSFLETTINECKQETDAVLKKDCIQNNMNRAVTTLGLKVEFCDKDTKYPITNIADVNQEINFPGTRPSTRDATIVGNVTQVTIGGIDLFSISSLINQNSLVPSITQTATPTAPTATPAVQTTPQNYVVKLPTPAKTATPQDVTVTIDDGTGQINVNLKADALKWTDYDNKDNPLYAENAFIRKGDKVMMRIQYPLQQVQIPLLPTNSKQEIFTDKFEDVQLYPEDLEKQELLKIVRTIADCATSAKECKCALEKFNMLSLLNITGDNGENILTYTTELGNEMIIDLPFEVTNNLIDINPAMNMDVYVANGKIIAGTPTDVCVPKRTYNYICSALIGHEELGTTKYALKI